MQFVVLSDVNATDFTAYLGVPIFRDPSPGRAAWLEMAPEVTKHDTFVFSKAGVRTLYWDASARVFAQFSADIRQAVEALGR